MLTIYVIIFHGQQMFSFSLEHILCYHLCYHLMLSFNVIISPPFQPGSLEARNRVGKRLLYRPASTGVLEQSMGGLGTGVVIPARQPT